MSEKNFFAGGKSSFFDGVPLLCRQDTPSTSKIGHHRDNGAHSCEMLSSLWRVKLKGMSGASEASQN
jgi:hypothetical protein